MNEETKPKQKHKMVVVIALFLAMLVVLLGFILHNNYNNSIYKLDIQAARAHFWARYLALEFELAEDNDTLRAKLPSLVTSIMAQDSSILEIQVVAGTSFLFHTNPAKTNQAINPEDAADKSTYDDSTQINYRLKKEHITEKFLLSTDDHKQRLTLVEPALKSAKKMKGIVKLSYSFKKEIKDGFYWIWIATLVVLGLFILLIYFLPRYEWTVTIPALLVLLVVTLFLFSIQGNRIKQDLLTEKKQHLETVTSLIAQQNKELLGEYVRSLKEGKVAPFVSDWKTISLTTPAAATASYTTATRFIQPVGADYAIQIDTDSGYQRTYQKEFNRRARVIAFVFLAIAYFLLFFILAGYAFKTFNALKKNYYSYLYIFPSMAGMVVLVLFPFVWGMSMGFFRITHKSWTFVGLQNFVEILGDFHPLTPGNFYFTLLVTVLWTVLNVMLHVGIGLMLALVLNRPHMKLKKVYRVLLILPWAIPNYITALIWKGMFHKQFGAINAFLQWLGVEPISWFNNFWTAFAANLMTNTWLGFPFMMVISLGALQAIPAELYEASEMDGATRWQQFRNITLPLLKPALFPAIILGTIWTFNMFNIIYLVSNGAPNRATDILITQAYRFAFENFNWGFAAAYSIIIFVILLTYGIFTNRATKASEGVFD